MQPTFFNDWRQRLQLEQREVQPAGDGQAEAQPHVDHAEVLDQVIARTKYSKADRDLLRRTLCKDASEDQFALFMRYAERTGLDPFARQIHLVIRKGKACIQTGIDGLRLVADRTKRYAGNDAPVFEGEGQLPGGGAHPLQATVTVWKIVDGVRQPFSATVRWQEFAPPLDLPDSFMWKKMAFNQLAKCAEAQALRKAFPADMAGVYTAEDLEAPEDPPSPRPPARATIDQRRALDRLRIRLGMDSAEMLGLIAEQGFRSSADMTAEAAEELLVQLEGLAADQDIKAGRPGQRQPGEDG